MHVPDHFLDPATSIATAAAAAIVVTLSARAARRNSSSAPAPALIGTATAGVFGLQMLNIPISAGTSGHLLGGALLVALLGPVWATLGLTTIVIVQATVFADGGLTALGTNILLMAVIAVWTAWGVRTAITRATSTRLSAPILAALSGVVSVPVTAAAFAVLYSLGGTEAVPFGELFLQMTAVHLAIGVIEAFLTGGVLIATSVGAPRWPSWTLGAVAVAAAMLAPFASSFPDGLEATAQALGFARGGSAGVPSYFPLADYGEVAGVSVQLAGMIGALLCVGIATTISAALRRTTAPSMLSVVP